MPELPEIETLKNDLTPVLVGRQFRAARVLWARSIAEPSPEDFVRRLAGQVIHALGRHGKYLILHLSRDYLLIHLRMSGRLYLAPADAPQARHVRVSLELNDGEALLFEDPRKFGRLWLVEDPAYILSALGPDALDPELSCEALAARLAGRRRQLKPLLLDQSFIAGLGNIYADEVLFQARLHPLRLTHSLSPEEQARLHSAIRHVLERAVAGRGTTFDALGFRDLRGEPGNFQQELAVFRQAGAPCPRCGTPIVRIVVGQRGTHLCPTCQPLN